MSGVDARASLVSVSGEELKVSLVDGRKISVPLSWFPRLRNATFKQRQKFQLIGGGVGIHWPEIDEDLSVAGLLAGWLPDSRLAVKNQQSNGRGLSKRTVSIKRKARLGHLQ